MKSPERIRREAIPVTHYGIIYSFVGGILGLVLWFGLWGAFHREQVRRYPQYVSSAIKSDFFPHKRDAGMTADQLRYSLMRFGNVNHRYDLELLRQGWYPRGTTSPALWIYQNAAITPIYAESAVLVLKWPAILTLLTFIGCMVLGLVADARYRAKVLCGIPFDGTVVTDINEYEKVTRGDGMMYQVKDWRDR